MNFPEKFFAGALMCLLAGLLAACNSHPSPRGWDSEIGPEGGALIGYLEDGIEVKLEIPPNAVKGKTNFTMKLLKPEEVGLPRDMPVVGSYVMEMGPDGSDFFERPLQLTVSRANSSTEATPYGSLYYHNIRSKTWEPVAFAKINPRLGTGTYILNHFSTYALLHSNVQINFVKLLDPIIPDQLFRLEIDCTHLGEGVFSGYKNINQDVLLHAYYSIGGGDVPVTLNPTFLLPVDQNNLWTVFATSYFAGTLATFTIKADIAGSSDQWTIFQKDLITDLEPVSFPLGDIANETDLLEKYSPILQFAENETYRPMTVDSILEKATEFEIKDPLWPEHIIREQEYIWTSTETDLNSRKNLLAMYGSNYSYLQFDGDGPQYRVIGGTPTPPEVSVYGRVVIGDVSPWGNVAILTYFMIYPFDKKVGSVGHTGDRESIAVILDIDEFDSLSSEPKAVSFGQHAEGQTLATIIDFEMIEWNADVITLPWQRVDSYGNHSVGYIANGSHAVYPRPGWKKIVDYQWPEFAGGGRNYCHNVELHQHISESYALEVLPNLQNISDGWQWLLYSGAFVRGQFIIVDNAVLGNCPIIPFINRWYAPSEWVAQGMKAYTATTIHGHPIGDKKPIDVVEFSDLEGTDWFYESVVALRDMGIVTGDGDTGELRPEDDVTRAEFLKMVTAGATQAGRFLPSPVTASETFTDVNIDDWFYEYVLIGVHNGIIENGSSANGYLFRPGDPLNRAEAVKMVVEAFDVTAPTPLIPRFSDVVPGSWYASYVYKAAYNHVVGGYPDNTFKPDNNINRAEAAKIVWQAYKGVTK